MYVVANEVTKAHGEACDKASQSLNNINNKKSSGATRAIPTTRTRAITTHMSNACGHRTPSTAKNHSQQDRTTHTANTTKINPIKELGGELKEKGKLLAAKNVRI